MMDNLKNYEHWAHSISYFLFKAKHIFEAAVSGTGR